MATTLGVAFAGTNVASAQQVTLVSSAADGTPGNKFSSEPSISITWSAATAALGTKLQ